MDPDRFKYSGDAPEGDACRGADMPQRLHLCHDTVTLAAGGSFEMFPQAAAYTHRLQESAKPTTAEAQEIECEEARAEEARARKVERDLRSQDPLDFVRAGARATEGTLQRMADGVSELLAMKDALIESKALPVTVLLPMTLVCSKLLRTRESHKHAIDDLLAQVKRMSPPSLLEERETLLQRLADAEETIDDLKHQEETRLLAVKIHRREMVSQKWIQLAVKLKAAKQRMDHRIVTTRLKARNITLNRRLDGLVESNRLRTKAGGAQKLIRENVGMLVQPRTPSPDVSDDEAGPRTRDAPSTAPVGDGRSTRRVQESMAVHRANTPRQSSEALMTEVDRTLTGVSFEALHRRRPDKIPATTSSSSTTTGKPSPLMGPEKSFVFSMPRPGTVEYTPIDTGRRNVLVPPAPSLDDRAMPGIAAGDQPSPSSLETMPFVNTGGGRTGSRGGTRRSRGARYRVSSQTPSELAEAHTAPCDGAADGYPLDLGFVHGAASHALSAGEDSYVLDSAREMATGPARHDGGKGGIGNAAGMAGLFAAASPPTVPVFDLRAVTQVVHGDTRHEASVSQVGMATGESDSTDEMGQRRPSDYRSDHDAYFDAAASDGSTVIFVPTPPWPAASDADDESTVEGSTGGVKETPYRTDQRPSTAYEGGNSVDGLQSVDGTDWAMLGASDDGATRPATASALPESGRSAFVPRFDEDSVPRAEVMELKLRHSMQMRAVQRAFEERLQILNRFWQQKGVDMLDRKVCDVGVGIDAPAATLPPPPSAAQIASRAAAGADTVTHKLRAGDPSVIRTSRPVSVGNPPTSARQSSTSVYLNSNGKPIPHWRLQAQSSRPSPPQSPREFRILAGGYHAFVYPARKELVSRADSRSELRAHDLLSHEKQNSVKPFKAAERRRPAAPLFASRHCSKPVAESPRAQTAPAGVVRSGSGWHQLGA
eukprot:jgi/Tetstr1/444879/TSEL_032720.t1